MLVRKTLYHPLKGVTKMKTNSQKTNQKLWLSATIGFALLLLVATPQTATAQQWTTNGNNISNANTGNVGVGTPSPDKLFTVQGALPSWGAALSVFRTTGSNNGFGLLLDATGSGNNNIGFSRSGTLKASSAWDTSRNFLGFANFAYSATDFSLRLNLDGSLTYHDGSSSTERFRITAAGNVGIGTASPVANLDVRTGTVALPPGGGLDPNVYHTWFPFSDGKNYIRGATIIADQGGNVGIGTTSPSYLLDVAGPIRSSSVGFRFPDNTVQSTAATMTGVTAGAGLTGGGTAGTVTLTNSDKGSTQYIFKNVANSAGTTQFSAGTNNDAVRFAGSGGTSVTFDAATKKVTIDGSTSTPSAANISAGQFGQNTGGGNYTFPGNVTVNGNIAAKYQDMAEWVPSSEQLPTGTVVALDSNKSNQVIASTQAYDTRVAGVVSEQPGIALGESGSNKVLVAMTGRVMVKVDASRGPIHIGDLLVTSDVPGLAMKSEPVSLSGVLLHRPGTLIGKALEPLEKGSGKILVLLSLQ